MKYFVVSDIHGFYDEFMLGLKEVNFDKDNENHTLIVLGDLFDRGPDVHSICNFLDSLKRVIVIRGNHEDLLVQALNRGNFIDIDYHNGTAATIVRLSSFEVHEALRLASNELTQSLLCDDVTAHTTIRNRIYNMKDYFETEHYVFVHGWVPTMKSLVHVNNSSIDKLIWEIRPDWRTATKEQWTDARWTLATDIFAAKSEELYVPNKKMVCGHCAAALVHNLVKYGHTKNFHNIYNFEPYVDDKMIVMDCCTAASHMIKVMVLED